MQKRQKFVTPVQADKGIPPSRLAPNGPGYLDGPERLGRHELPGWLAKTNDDFLSNDEMINML